MKNNNESFTTPEKESITEIEFQSEGQVLHGRLFFPGDIKPKNPGIIFVHGWGGDQEGKTELALELNHDGYVVMTFNLRGHGSSEGNLDELNLKNFIKDVESAYDFLIKEEKVDPDKISVIGNSFGSYLAARLVETRDIENLIIHAPANYPDSVLDQPSREYMGIKSISDWRQLPLNPDATRSLQAVHNFTGNVLVVESEKDTFVPHQTTENYVKAVSDQSRIDHELLVNTPHSIKDPNQRQAYNDTVTSWLRKKSDNNIE